MSMSKPTYLSPCLNSKGTKAVSVATTRSSARAAGAVSTAALSATAARNLLVIRMAWLPVALRASSAPDACKSKMLFLKSRRENLRLIFTGSGSVDGVSESRHNLLNLLAFHDERRGQQHVVAVHAVDGAPHGVDHEPARHRLAFDPRVNLFRRI